MELDKMLEFLYSEKEKLERVIAAMEDLHRSGSAMPEVLRVKSRRGRKSMGAEERQDVSERMKKYWAGRRASQGQDAPPAQDR
jgi:hypothetical protein